MNKSHTRFSGPFIELHQSLDSHSALVSSFIEQLMQFIKRFLPEGADGERRGEEIKTALMEVLTNAIVHGNQRNPQKQVYVTCRCTMNGEVSIAVQDEGGATEFVPGRLTSLMDEVSFEKNGSVIRMRKWAA